MQNLSVKLTRFNIKSFISSVVYYSTIKPTSDMPMPIRRKDMEMKSRFLMKAVGITRKKALSVTLMKNEFQSVSMDSMKYSYDILKNAGYDSSIKNFPELLSIDGCTLKNRILLLEESGFHEEKIPFLLSNFDSLPCKKIFTLKNFDFLPSTANIIENFFNVCNVPKNENLVKLDDWDTFKDAYSKFFKFYVKRELSLNDDEVEIVSKPIKWICFRHLRLNVNFIRDVYFSCSRNLQHLKHLLHADPDCTLSLLKLYGNRNMIDVMKKFPELLRSAPETVIKNYQFLRKKNITEFAPSYWSLLTMNSELNFYRLSKILETHELQPYVNHPRLLTLIKKYPLASERLDLLKKLDMNCYSLNQLTCASKNFVRHVTNRVDKVRCCDKVTFLCGELPYTKSEIQRRLKLNPYVGYVPLHVVSDTLYYLKEVEFCAEDIFISLPVVLYRRKVVQNSVENSVPDLLKSMNYPVDSNIQKLKVFLPLVLYCLEKCIGFTGDGIWVGAEKAKETALSANKFV